VRLLVKGLAHIPRRVDHLTFVIGSRRYHCPSLIAEFCSLRVNELQSIHDAMKKFHVQLDVEDTKDVFSEFISVNFGTSTTSDSTHLSTLLSICSDLGNPELDEAVCR
jgi:hypothetical protein